MQGHPMTLAPPHTIWVGGIIRIFYTKPQILLLFTILPKIIQILQVSNAALLHHTNLYPPSTKIQFGKFDGKVHLNSNQN